MRAERSISPLVHRATICIRVYTYTKGERETRSCYINATAHTLMVKRGGRVPLYLELACLRIIDFLLISYLKLCTAHSESNLTLFLLYSRSLARSLTIHCANCRLLLLLLLLTNHYHYTMLEHRVPLIAAGTYDMYTLL